MMATMFHL